MPKTCEEVGCKWPECECKVPSHYWSEYLRRTYCQKLKEKKETNGKI